jgi:hypothetical protein
VASVAPLCRLCTWLHAVREQYACICQQDLVVTESSSFCEGRLQSSCRHCRLIVSAVLRVRSRWPGALHSKHGPHTAAGIADLFVSSALIPRPPGLTTRALRRT